MLYMQAPNGSMFRLEALVLQRLQRLPYSARLAARDMHHFESEQTIFCREIPLPMDDRTHARTCSEQRKREKDAARKRRARNRDDPSEKRLRNEDNAAGMRGEKDVRKRRSSRRAAQTGPRSQDEGEEDV